jgi:hypothetical protein
MTNDVKHKWKTIVRREFGAPAKVVIKSFAESGYSKRLTAAALEINRQTLRVYCIKEGIVFPSRNDLRDECRPRPCPSSMKGTVRNPWGRAGKPKQ